jgi:hypothetical protein
LLNRSLARPASRALTALDLHEALADRRRYERQIERLHQRYLLSSRLYELRQDEVSLASMISNGGKFARLLAREVEAGRYALEPGELRTIRARHKLREVFTCRLTDVIVHGVVADVVQEALAPQMSSRVFSYRKGVASLEPISEFAAYLRAGRRAEMDPRRRGVYVLRRDVASYTDSIPIGEGSPLWSMLDAGLGRPLPLLVEQVIRVEMRLPGGGLACRTKGLPMGQPITSVVANLYLRELDRALQGIPGGFYARFGDDFLFAHPAAGVAREADALIDAELDRLSLTVNDQKRSTAYLTSPGRPSSEWPAARGASGVPFLGARVSAEGTIGLDGRKIRALLRDIDRRTAATVRTLRGADREDIGRAACAAVNGALDPHNALTQHRSAFLLRRAVTDRRQLEQLDYWIARTIARALTGRRADRAFRALPYRKLRREWGLVSLVAARNER